MDDPAAPDRTPPLPPLPPEIAGLPLDHVGVAVPDLDAGAAPWALLGLPVAHADETVAGQGVRVRALAAGSVLLELLAPTGPDSPIARHLERRGPGVHHLALRVDDLDAVSERLEAAFGEEGAPFLAPARPGRAGTRVRFLHPRWCGGVLVELVEHPSESTAGATT